MLEDIFRKKLFNFEDISKNIIAIKFEGCFQLFQVQRLKIKKKI